MDVKLFIVITTVSIMVCQISKQKTDAKPVMSSTAKINLQCTDKTVNNPNCILDDPSNAGKEIVSSKCGGNGQPCQPSELREEDYEHVFEQCWNMLKNGKYMANGCRCKIKPKLTDY